MNSVLYYIWLSLRVGAGNEKGSFILSKFGSPEKIYAAERDELSAAIGDDEGLLNALCDKQTDMAERILEYCQRTNVGILTPESAVYPQRLRSIYAKPMVLYYKGAFPDVDKNVLIACVGTRKCSEKGARNAYKLGAELSDAGALVVSGMASGIDTMCARGALSVRGHTVAVLGCGIDRVYPPENAALMKSISENGTVITEYAPGMPPNGKHFPMRNRIISGLSLGTVVVEAGRYSGALITAEHARKQGRDIFAFPGDVENQNYDGTNMLIRDGAKMVRGAADILAEYENIWHGRIFTGNIKKNKYYTGNDAVYVNSSEGEKFGGKVGFFGKRRSKKSLGENAAQISDVKDLPKNESAHGKKSESSAENEALCAGIDDKVLKSLDGTEKLVYENLHDSMTGDEIALSIKKKTGKNIDMGEILGALTSLEIDGYCRELPGGLFIRT